MKMQLHIIRLSLLTSLCLALGATAFAGNIYTNGPTNGHSNALFIQGDQASDDWPVTCSICGVTQFSIAEWVEAGATPLAIDWAIGTTPFGSQIGSGRGTWSSVTLLCSNGGMINGGPCGGGLGYDVYMATENVGPFEVAGGTYWLSLTGATDSLGGRDGWDVNSGPSLAFYDQQGQVPSESFTIGGTTATLEPSSITLFGSGILGIGGVLRRRLMR